MRSVCQVKEMAPANITETYRAKVKSPLLGFNPERIVYLDHLCIDDLPL